MKTNSKHTIAMQYAEKSRQPAKKGSAEKPRSRKHGFWKRVDSLLNLCLAFLIPLVILLFLNTTDYGIAGYHIYIVPTGSMYPLILPGDIILQKNASSAQIGDVAIYDPTHVPEYLARENKTLNRELPAYIIHRVMDKYEQDGTIYYVFKGDHNQTSDWVPIPEKDINGILVWCPNSSVEPENYANRPPWRERLNQLVIQWSKLGRKQTSRKTGS